MKVAGIIAEYNPFHQGHKYQLDMLRRQFQPDYIIVAMSGDFLQRGVPALMDKYARSRMSLLQGADLILELPVCFATASAESFARGGLMLFETTGLTDALCFGAESNDLARLTCLAHLLNQEPDWYRDALQSSLKRGLSFPAARAKALPEYGDLLNLPNNILAIEYLKAMETLAPTMKPLLIQRKGSGYHDTDITAPLASASAIRKSLLKHSAHWPALTDALPEESRTLMQEYEKTSSFLQEDDFSLLLHSCLLGETRASLTEYLDMTEDLANRIFSQKKDFVSWSSFCQSCNTKDSTYARISRVLTHMLLNIRKEDVSPYLTSRTDTLPYLRILGFRKSAAPLLTQLSRCARAPLVTSPAAAEELLAEPDLAMLRTDIYASDLYRCVLTGKTGRAWPGEYQRKLLIVE